MNNPTVGVVILNYIEYQETINYISNLKMQEDICLFILVVDNCSPNNSFKALKELYHSDNMVEVIQSEKNGGYSYGNNYGVQYFLKEKDVDYILISNNDIFLRDKKLISKLIIEYNKCNNPAFISPIMLINGEEDKFSAWKLPTIKDDIKDSLFTLKKLFKSECTLKFSVDDKENKEVECLPGSFFLGKKEIFSTIKGVFDNKVFLYCEERIIYWKVKNSGLKNYLIRSLDYDHQVSGTIKKIIKRKQQQKQLVESRIYFHKNYINSNPILTTSLKFLYYLWCIEAFFYYNFFKNGFNKKN